MKKASKEKKKKAIQSSNRQRSNELGEHIPKVIGAVVVKEKLF